MCQKSPGYLPGFHEVPRGTPEYLGVLCMCCTLGYPSASLHTLEYPEVAQGTLGYSGVFRGPQITSGFLQVLYEGRRNVFTMRRLYVRVVAFRFATNAFICYTEVKNFPKRLPMTITYRISMNSL